MLRPSQNARMPAEPFERVLAEPTGGQDMGGQEVGLAGNRRAALVGDQRHVMPAALQLARQREGRDQMPAGAAGGQHVMLRSAAHA